MYFFNFASCQEKTKKQTNKQTKTKIKTKKQNKKQTNKQKIQTSKQTNKQKQKNLTYSEIPVFKKSFIFSQFARSNIFDKLVVRNF